MARPRRRLAFPAAPGPLVACLVALGLPAGCGGGGGGDAGAGVDATPDAPAVTAPERVARFPDARPFDVVRAADLGEGPGPAEVEAFTRRMLRFYTATDLIRWVRRHAHGVAASNPWGEPPYLFWWQDVHLVKEGDLVTFVHEGGADNMMAHHGRLFGPLVGAYLTLSGTGEREPLRELVLGSIRGVSATLKGSIWAEEDPVVDTIMARAIFHRNHAWELDGGRRAAVDYEPERRELLERRHDTLHNPANPTWGDIWVRTKRSKDDFPWVYRMPVHLSRLLWTTDDPELREAALELYDQLQAMAADILEHGYVIRAKTHGGEVFVPYLEGKDQVDDFATMVAFEDFLPNAECNAKLPVALIATGEPQGNACGDGLSTTYEELGLARCYCHTWMQWNFHVASIATALLYGDHEQARAMLVGLGARLDALHVRDDAISQDPRYPGDVAQLLVLAAAYGLPLTGDEARMVHAEYGLAADHYEPYERWDPWRADVPDGTYDYLPSRESGSPSRTHIDIEEMPNLLEYCASPVRARDGAQILDCALLTSPAEWPPAP